jgi:hypothetical protein
MYSVARSGGTDPDQTVREKDITGIDMHRTVREQRSQNDRRKRPTPPLSLYTLFGRRRWLRRGDESVDGGYVDRYGVKAVVAILSVILLGIMDGVFTLLLIQQGAKEINPVMAFFLGLGAGPFLIVKYSLTGLSGLTLLIHKNFHLGRTRISVKQIVVAVFILYAMLIVYELVLLRSLSTPPAS